MQLIIESQEAQSATIPVRWCLNRAERQVLDDANADPTQTFVFLLVQVERRGDWIDFDRYLVPIDEVMHYLTFRQAGRHRIKAVVVFREDQQDDRRESLHSLTKENNPFNNEYFPPHKLPSFYNFPQWRANLLEGGAEVEVVVGEEFFAKKPWDWNWTNLWFETKPRDQCQLRRRRFVAYTIQPILVAFFFGIFRPIVKIVLAAILLLWGIRPNKIPWKAVFWLNIDIEDVDIENRKDDFFRYKANGDDQPRWPQWFRPLFVLPAVFLLGFFLQTSLVEIESRDSVPMASLWVFGVPSGIFLAICGLILFWQIIKQFFRLVWLVIRFVFVSVIGSVIRFLWNLIPKGKETEEQKLERARLEAARFERMIAANKLKDKKRTTKEEERVRRELEAERAYQQKVVAGRQRSLQAVACETTTSFAPRISDLPKDRRTIHLRFWDLKAKICKPFA